METHVYCASSGEKRLVDGHIQFVNNVGSDQSIKKVSYYWAQILLFLKIYFSGAP